jgi:hypothetical protein
VLLLAASLVPYLAPRLHHSGIAAAIFSGIMFGLASLYTKGMTDYYFLAHAPGTLARVVANPYVYAMIITNIAGLIALQNSFAAVRGIIAMPLSTALSNIIPIAGASAAFGEHLPRAPWAAAMRMTAFGLTIAGAALLTNPGEHPAAPCSTGQVPSD